MPKESPHKPRPGWKRFRTLRGVLCSDRQIKDWMVGRLVRIEYGWVVGEAVETSQSWTPVLMDLEDEPEFVKTSGIEIIEDNGNGQEAEVKAKPSRKRSD